MTETVVVKDPQVIVRVSAQHTLVAVAQPGLVGPQGPQGPAEHAAYPSLDDGNAITTGSDGGLYCPAVLNGISHW